MTTKIRFSRTYPLPNYTGPVPVYRAHFPWAGARDCYVRRTPAGIWETALADAPLAACHFAGASETRYSAVMAFDFYHADRTPS